jgi:hypothetical protein
MWGPINFHWAKNVPDHSTYFPLHKKTEPEEAELISPIQFLFGESAAPRRNAEV